jgi:hypothetical protein
LIEGEDDASRLRNAVDAWTAGFFFPRGSGRERSVATKAMYGTRSPGARARRTALIDELSDRLHFFHWRLEFT